MPRYYVSYMVVYSEEVEADAAKKGGENNDD